MSQAKLSLSSAEGLSSPQALAYTGFPLLCFSPSRHIHHPPHPDNPCQITLLLGSSVALRHLFRIEGEREKRERKERRQGREIYHINFGSPGTFCLWFVLFPCVEGTLGRGSGLPPWSIPPGTLAARSKANSRWHPAPRGTSKDFGAVAAQAAALTPSKGAGCKQREDSEQSSFKQQRCAQLEPCVLQNCIKQVKKYTSVTSCFCLRKARGN